MVQTPSSSWDLSVFTVSETGISAFVCGGGETGFVLFDEHPINVMANNIEEIKSLMIIDFIIKTSRGCFIPFVLNIKFHG
jgi:hypothetical protein